ncbi:MAG: serine/threonine-protein kinase, partial [Planctomycetota bacterium]|nr:serine/threonine-protein kinase [Planctomycetota bacterium]
MDRNQLLGQVLLSQGLATKELILHASDDLQGQSQLDVCDWLVERKLLSAAQADNVRFKVNLSASAKMLSSAHPIRRRPSESQVVAARKSIERGSSTQPRFGDYQIERELHHGPVGSVYAARSSKSGKSVALKIFAPGPLNGPQTVQRFLLDAKANSQLTHPQIAPIYDFGEVDGQQFLTMELIEGVSLKEMVEQRGVLEANEAATLVLKIARGLAYSHQSGLLHRDLKPSSVIVRGIDQEPVLTDFGFRGDPKLRATGPHKSLEYSAPELVDGEIEFVDQRVDIYSLGATLYKLLTGQSPFEGRSLDSVLSAILKGEISDPREMNRKIPKDLATVCVKCLAREPAARYVGATQLADDLERFLNGDAILATPDTATMLSGRIKSVGGGRFSWIVAILILLAVTAMGIQAFKVIEERRGDRRRETRRELVRSTQKTLQHRSAQWQSRLRETFESVEKTLKRHRSPTQQNASEESRLGFKDAQQLIDDIDSALSRYLSPFKTRAYLSEDPLENSLGPRSSEDLEALVKQTMDEIPILELQAQGRRLKGLVWQKFGDESKARMAWAEAYSEAPRSRAGLLAFLESGESLAQSYKLPAATRILRQLLKNERATEDMKSRACLSLSRLAIARGRFDEAGLWLKRRERQLPMAEDKEEAELYRGIATQLSGSATLENSELGDLCRGKTDRPVFSRIVGGHKVELNRLRWNGEALSMEPWVHWTIAEYVRRVTVTAVKGELRIVVELGRFVTDALQAFRIRENKVEKWGDRCALPKNLVTHEVVSMGDLNNNGQLDVVMRNREHHNHGTLVFDIVNTAPVKIYPIPSQSCCPAASFVDLDGDSVEELALSLGKWSDYRLAIFNWEPKSEQLKLRFEKILGFPIALSVRAGENGRPELLQLVDRSHRFDLRGVFGDDLNPALPDAIWSVQFDPKMKQFQTRPVVKWPFSDRNDISPLWLCSTDQLFAHYPHGLLYYTDSKRAGAVWSFNPGFGKASVQLQLAKGPAEIEFADIDSDGDQEAIVVQEQSIRVFGLKLKASSDAERIALTVSGVED